MQTKAELEKSREMERPCLTISTAQETLRYWENQKIINPIQPRLHSLPGELIVSLTSYGPRLRTLHLTLKSLLEQTVIPDRIIVWIAHHEFASIPEKSRLLDEVIEFRACEDIKSYKKLIFALSEFPDANIVVADDDVYYHRQWLEQLVESGEAGRADIVCHVAYRYHFEHTGDIAAYAEWSSDVQDMYSRAPSLDLLPVGGGGVLFPPRCLHADVSKKQLFETLCPHGDDLWFFAMARLVGTKVRKVGPRLVQVSWPGSQDSALWRENVPTRNDVNVKNLIRHYGNDIFPCLV